MSQYTVPYHEALDQLREACQLPVAGLMFTTQIRNKLMSIYLRHVVEVGIEQYGEEGAKELRQQFTCTTCARFMKRMGNVISFDEFGKAKSVYWNPDVIEHPFMKEVATRMKRDVESSRVINIFNPDGVYASYEEHTNFQEKDFKHYYFPMHELFAKQPERLIPYRELDISSEIDRVHALVRFVKTVTPAVVMKVEAWFDAQEIRHKGNSKNALRDFNQLAVAILKITTSPLYTIELRKNEYAQETLIVNTVWNFIGRFPELRTLSGSSLGALLSRAADGNEDAFAKNEWKSNTSAINHRRPKTDASERQVTETLDWLRENDYLPSMEQRPMLQSELPVIYTFPKLYDGVVPTVEVEKTGSAFEQFAKKDEVAKTRPVVEQGIDFGSFVNNVVPLIDSMGLNLNNLQVIPIYFNIMKDQTAKPIFKWDTEEKRVPWIGFSYVEAFPLDAIVRQKPAPFQFPAGEKYVFPIRAITNNREVGTAQGSKTSWMMVLEGVHNPIKPKPTLFSDSLKPEFYDHRRALEQFMRDSELENTDEQIATVMTLHQLERGEIAEPVTLRIHVLFNEAGQAQYGADKGIFSIRPRYLNTIDEDKLRALATGQEVAPTPVEEPEVPAEAEEQAAGMKPVM